MASPSRDPRGVRWGIAALVERYRLTSEAGEKLWLLLSLLVEDPLAPTRIKTPAAALNDHLADSLVALDCDAVRAADRILDLGAGAGLPGLPLAIGVPRADVTLLESSSRRCHFIHRAIEACRVPNAEVVQTRAESFEAGRARYDAVTARAVAPLPVTLEYAAPLLRLGGTVIAWRGRREPETEAAASHAAAELGLGEPAIFRVHPYAGARHRHLVLVAKTRETPSRFPRRPGVALKRPLGEGGRTPHTSSDRAQR